MAHSPYIFPTKVLMAFLTLMFAIFMINLSQLHHLPIAEKGICFANDNLGYMLKAKKITRYDRKTWHSGKGQYDWQTTCNDLDRNIG